MSTTLSSNEHLVQKEKFTPRLLVFWLKVDLSLTNKRIIGSTPNIVLNLIPFGRRDVTFPLKNIAGVLSSTKFFFKRFLLGIILIAGGYALMESNLVLSVPLIVLGIIYFLNCYTSTLIITNSAGQKEGVEISILEKEKLSRFAGEVNNKVMDI